LLSPTSKFLLEAATAKPNSIPYPTKTIYQH